MHPGSIRIIHFLIHNPMSEPRSLSLRWFPLSRHRFPFPIHTENDRIYSFHGIRVPRKDTHKNLHSIYPTFSISSPWNFICTCNIIHHHIIYHHRKMFIAFNWIFELNSIEAKHQQNFQTNRFFSSRFFVSFFRIWLKWKFNIRKWMNCEMCVTVCCVYGCGCLSIHSMWHERA